MFPRTSVLVVAAFSLVGCGKEVGRVPFTGVGTADTTMVLKAGQVAFWTDLDVQYEGNASMQYEISLVQGTTVAATVVCNPLGELPAKTGWVETNLGASHTRRGKGEMVCTATAPEGTTTVHVTLGLAPGSSAVTLKKADLVVKQ